MSGGEANLSEPLETSRVSDLVHRLEAVLEEAEVLFEGLQAQSDTTETAAICGEIADTVHAARRTVTKQLRWLAEARKAGSPTLDRG